MWEMDSIHIKQVRCIVFGKLINAAEEKKNEKEIARVGGKGQQL